MSYILQVVGLPSNSYKPITNTAWVRAQLCKLQKGCTRLVAASEKVYQLLAHGRWFSPGTPASSTTKTGRHDIAEILLKVALSTKKSKIKIKSIPSGICINLDYHVQTLRLYCSKRLLFGFPIFLFLVYLMKVIPETRRGH